jgi:hypothetical protein
MDKFNIGDHVKTNTGYFGVIVQKQWTSFGGEITTSYGVETEASPDLLWLSDSSLTPFAKSKPEPRVESNTYRIERGIKTVQVILENPMPDYNYCVQVQIENMKDANPQIMHCLLRQRTPTSFMVELSHTTDSDNYRLIYVAIPNVASMFDLTPKQWEELKRYLNGSDKIKVDGKDINPKDLDNAELIAVDKQTGEVVGKIKNVKLDAKPECRQHKWKTYTGLFEKYDYCEICDCKRSGPEK